MSVAKESARVLQHQPTNEGGVSCTHNRNIIPVDLRVMSHAATLGKCLLLVCVCGHYFLEHCKTRRQSGLTRVCMHVLLKVLGFCVGDRKTTSCVWCALLHVQDVVCQAGHFRKGSETKQPTYYQKIVRN